MPYSHDAEYRHHRQKDPRSFDKSSFRTVPLSHTDYHGRKFKRYKDKAIVGYNVYHRRWEIQSILEKK